MSYKNYKNFVFYSNFHYKGMTPGTPQENMVQPSESNTFDFCMYQTMHKRE